MAAPLSDEVKKRVVRQVDFYFSDSNFPKDKFLRGHAEKHPDGWIDLSLVIAFARMRTHLKLKCETPDDVEDDVIQQVATVLRDSNSDTFLLSDDGYQIKRKHPIPDMKDIVRAVDSRSLYVRPFPYTVTLDQLTDFFEEHGPVNCVRLRRHVGSKDFKGSVFVEFTTPEVAQQVSEKEMVFEGAPLRCEPKIAYMHRKIALRKSRPGAADAPKPKLQEIEEEDSEVEIECIKETNSQYTEIPDTIEQRLAYLEAQKRPRQESEFRPGKRMRGDGDQRADGDGDGAAAMEADGQAAANGATEAPAPQFTPGCLLRVTFSAGPPPSALHPRLLRDFFTENYPQPEGRHPVRFVEYERDTDFCVVRFSDPSIASDVLAALSAQPEAERLVSGFQVEVARIEGDEEEEYYREVDRKKAEMAAHYGGRGGGGRAFRGGNRGSFRGRGGFRGGGRGRGRYH